MLVLTRNIGETLIIGKNGEIRITILDGRPLSAKTVRIGIEAPKDTLILREEIYKPKEEFDVDEDEK